MKKLFKKGSALLMTFMLSSFTIMGCGSTSSNTSDNTESTDAVETAENTESTDEASGGTVKMVYVNWAEGVAMTNLAKAILEDKMGYDVEVTMADVAPIFTSLASGDQDIFMDSWLPTTHANYMEEYGNDIDDLGNNFEGAQIGLVVPSYVDIDSVDQLNDIANDIDSQIIGIDSGAGLMQATETVIDTYGLDLSLVSGSEAAMTATLSEAIDEGKPVVVTGWAPHWMFAKWDLKFLDDPQGVYGVSESIHTLSRKGFSEDMPEVAEFFKNFNMDSSTLGDLMGAIQDSDEDPDVVAQTWMQEHEDLVNSWIPSAE